MEFGERLKDLRKKSGLTQMELARKAGVTQTLVTYYETGARKPKLEKAVLLAKALNVAVEHFFDSKKPLKEKKIGLGVHKNSRSAKVLEVFEKLPSNDQRAFLKQMKSVIAQQEK